MHRILRLTLPSFRPLKLVVFLFGITLFVSRVAMAEEAVTLIYESAPAVTGPWTAVDPARIQQHPNGSSSVSTVAPTFFRMRIVSAGQSASIPVMTLSEVPPTTLKVAKEQPKQLLAVESSSAAEWEGAELAPFAVALGDATGLTGPAHFEFKVIYKPKPNSPGGFRKFSSDQDSQSDRGYIICSATDADVPISEYATEGGTPVEALLRKCGGVTPARILKYGDTFWVAEGASGELIANHGSEPFKIPAAYLEQLNTFNKGVIDTESALKQMPPTSKDVPEFYPTYQAFKADYTTNSLYKLLRRRRAEHSKILWDGERGDPPTILRVNVGQTNTFIPTRIINHLTVDDEMSVRTPADVDIIKGGGLRVYGRFAGRMAIKIRLVENFISYLVEVVSPAGSVAADTGGNKAALPSEPYWKVVTEAYAGNWNHQMRWYQLRSPSWCDLVGCGPTALGMMLGYWENVNSVESAFYTHPSSFSSLSTIDAPQFLDTGLHKGIVLSAYFRLHELCDVICNPFGDDGGTLPGDLIEGWVGYLSSVADPIGASSQLYGRGLPLVGYSSPWAYDGWGNDWDYSGYTAAVGIKAGRPAVVGLGLLEHYVVAYGYKRTDQFVKVNGEELPLGVIKREFKCNMGWKNSSPSWRSAYQVFLGLSPNMWQIRAPQQN